MKNMMLKLKVVLYVMVAFCSVAPAFAAKTNEIRLQTVPALNDYSEPIRNALNTLKAQGGGVLVIPYGKYPVLSEVRIESGEQVMEIELRGEKSATGELPLLFDTDISRDPHSFLTFTGNKDIQAGLTVRISNLDIQGNNIPLDFSKGDTPFVLDEGQTDIEPNPNLPRDKHYGHPFFFRADTGYSCGIKAHDIKSLHVDNVVVRDIYGNGILLANYANPEYAGIKPNHHNMGGSSITNSKIYNTWQWHASDDSGDGIMLWDIGSPRIENNLISNNIAHTRWSGRCGIVVEHHAANAVIKNNTIIGYARNIHIENTFGGHQVINNRLLGSDIGVVLNEPDSLHPAESKPYLKPNLIQGNFLRYDQERERFGVHPFGGPKAFIDVTVYRSNMALQGTQIIDNTFVYKTYKGVKINRWRRYDVENKTRHIYVKFDHSIDNWIERGNKFY